MRSSLWAATRKRLGIARGRSCGRRARVGRASRQDDGPAPTAYLIDPGRSRAGARAQSVRISVWRTGWQRGRSALDFLSQLLRGTPVALGLPP
jgi:hypothetical protein